MPSPKNTTRTLAEVRAECLALGITPGRSIVECEKRIAQHAKDAPLRAWADDMKRDTLPQIAETIIGVDVARGPDTAHLVKMARHAAHYGTGAAKMIESFRVLPRTKRTKRRKRPAGVSIRDYRETKRRARQARATHAARKAN